MPINSRDKGAKGERELFALLSDELGYIVKRRLDAPREGGADSLDVPGWSIECKRYAKATDTDINLWWMQAAQQALNEGRKPVLFFRLDRGRWVAVIRACDISRYQLSERMHEAQIRLPLAMWCEIAREGME